MQILLRDVLRIAVIKARDEGHWHKFSVSELEKIVTGYLREQYARTVQVTGRRHTLHRQNGADAISLKIPGQKKTQ